MPKPTLYPSIIVLTSLILSIASPRKAESTCLQEQDMLVTAYYSPLPNQERYYLGSYDADIAFNGRGERAKDGTSVYPGMIAAPEEFPFGTRIAFPDLGVAGTVHDRGGRIVAGRDGIPRIDIWMGEGEEGLARALEWGARTVKAHIYVPEPVQIPDERFDLAAFPAPQSALERLPSNPISLINANDQRYGTTSPETAAIQYALKKLGYFDHDITSYYGDVTFEALRAFLRDARRHAAFPVLLTTTGGGEIADEPSRRLLIAHSTLADELATPLPGDDVLLRGTSGKPVRILQRMLKLLSVYDGEINGVYDEELMSIIYRFQTDREIVTSLTDTGAGMVGPQTRRALLTAWRNHRIFRRGGVEALVAAL